MTRFPSWYPVGGAAAQSAPAGWDAVTLGGITLNAWARLSGGGVPLKIDPRSTKGANTGRPTTHGLDTVEWTLQLLVIDLRQMEDCDDAFPLLCPPTNLEPVSLDHPQVLSIARLVGQVNVLVASTPSIWAPSSSPRGWTNTLRLRYWPVAAKQAQTGRSTTPSRAKAPVYDTKNAVAQKAAGADANPQPTTAANFTPPAGAR